MAKKKVKIIDYSSVEVLNDYNNGVLNYRVLAKKHKKSILEINKIIKK